MSMDSLSELFVKDKVVQSAQEFKDRVLAPCDEILRLLFETVKNRFDRKFGCFELFGVDFMLDSVLKPQLIEINTNPAIFTDTAVQKEMLPKLVDDTIGMALQLHPMGKLEGSKEVKDLLEKRMQDLKLPY